MSKLVNGIDLGKIQDYVSAVKADPANAQVTFVAKSKWGGGARADVSVSQFKVNGNNAARPDRQFTISTDEPAPLGGEDNAPNPAELIAAGLCGCLTAGIATNAALFDTEVDDIEVTVELSWDMHGILGLDKSVPSRASGLHYTVRLSGADPEKLRKAKETLDRKSAVLKTLQEAVPVTTDIVIG